MRLQRSRDALFLETPRARCAALYSRCAVDLAVIQRVQSASAALPRPRSDPYKELKVLHNTPLYGPSSHLDALGDCTASP